MKTEVILLSEIEDYLRYVKLEQGLRIRLSDLRDNQERNLKLIGELKQVSTALNILKEKYHFKTEEELVQAIRKYARRG